MKKIYVISRYAGNVEQNVKNAVKQCKYVMSKGYMPLASHLYFTQLTDDNIPEERRTGLNMGLELLAMCDEAWVFKEDIISPGMHGEIEKAKQLGVRLQYFASRDGVVIDQLGNLE